MIAPRIALLCTALICTVVSCGRVFPPKPTFTSPRRVVALEYDLSVTKCRHYLGDTNSHGIVEASLQGFDFAFGVMTLSSNSTDWRLQFSIDGKDVNGTVVHATTNMDIRFPNSAQIALPIVGIIKGHFASDQELARLSGPRR